MNKLNDITELIGIAYLDLKRNKVRTLLTSLGILIGISSIVLLISIGHGLKLYIEDQFKSLGSNLVIVMPGKLFSNGQINTFSTVQITSIFDEKDLLTIEKLKLTKVVAPTFAKFLEAKGTLETAYYETIISSADIFTILNSEIDQGRLFTKGDVEKRIKVAVLGSKPAEKLFGSPDNALNKNLKIENQTYKVIGILKSKGGGGFGLPSIDDHIFLPYKAAISFNPSKKFLELDAKTDNESDLDSYKEEITQALLKRYKADDFSVLDQREIFDTFSSIFSVVNIVLTGISAISLIVGGIGIMNIMFVSVAERVKEVGIRRAYGATKNDILMLFLSETVILSLIGGSLGLLIAYGAVLIIRRFFPAYIDLNSIILALSVSAGIGVIFGVLPARSASQLTPVEAIRKE